MKSSIVASITFGITLALIFAALFLWLGFFSTGEDIEEQGGMPYLAGYFGALVFFAIISGGIAGGIHYLGKRRKNK